MHRFALVAKHLRVELMVGDLELYKEEMSMLEERSGV